MITITSFLHRRELSDIIRRWMYAEICPSDAERIAQLVHFNHVFVDRYVRDLSERIFGSLHQGPLRFQRVARKGELKDVLILHPPYRNARIDSLIGNYREHPERYYRETPYHGHLIFSCGRDTDLCVGSNRIKRIRRLAEKASRRIIDRIFEAIKQHAETMADDRALRLGIPRQQLVTAPDEMLDEFLAAEARLTEDLRGGRPVAIRDEIMINDVAGLKVILEDSPDRVVTLIENTGRCRIVERERHAGRYNATNLIVEYEPGKEAFFGMPLPADIQSLMQARGWSEQDAREAFERFIREGEERVCLEIIVSDYQETLESEIGRCMHEDRIIEQRLRQEYRGHLAKNIGYLMEYLFSHPSSPRRELTDLPIKLWNRYLPDYFDEVLKELFRMSPRRP